MNRISIKNRSLESKPHELRAMGVVPGVIYGTNIENRPIKTAIQELIHATQGAGEVYEVMSENGRVYVKLDEIQKDPVSREILHFSLVQMPRGVVNEVSVPLNYEGTPLGTKNGGVLVIMKDEITINGMPRMIPENIAADVSKLEIGDKLTIGDLKIPKQVEAMDNNDEIIAFCKSPTKEVITSTTESEAEAEYSELRLPSNPAT